MQQVENARRRFAVAVEVGRLTYVRDSGGREAGRYYAAEPVEEPKAVESEVDDEPEVDRPPRRSGQRWQPKRPPSRARRRR